MVEIFSCTDFTQHVKNNKYNLFTKCQLYCFLHFNSGHFELPVACMLHSHNGNGCRTAAVCLCVFLKDLQTMNRLLNKTKAALSGELGSTMDARGYFSIWNILLRRLYSLCDRAQSVAIFTMFCFALKKKQKKKHAHTCLNLNLEFLSRWLLFY